MKRRHFLWLGLLTPAALARQELMSFPELFAEGEKLAREQLDPQVLAALPELDRARVDRFLTQLQGQFQGQYVVDLASLKQTARVMLPLLQSQPTTRPYAAWLSTRMDYFDVADQYRLTVPSPKPAPGQPPRPAPNPAPATQRQVWVKQVENRPTPVGAPPLVPKLRQLFNQAGVPIEMVWVAEVESNFEPSARSPAGAVGLYQLMPKTAEGLGLKLSPKDDRLVPEKNASAAARYLRALYPRFNDWRLTMAAYNWGQGNVRRLLDRQRAKSYDAIAVHLPAETQMYVPKIEAVLRRREKVELTRLRPPRA